MFANPDTVFALSFLMPAVRYYLLWNVTNKAQHSRCYRLGMVRYDNRVRTLVID